MYLFKKSLSTIQSKIWIIVCILFFCSTTYSQIPSFNNYTIEDGLPSNTIYEIKSDKDGFLWIATDSGIAKYDGYKFQTYDKKDGLTDNEIFGFFTDSKERMWLRTFNGTICYYHDGAIYNLSNVNFKNQILIKGIIKEITEDKNGNIYFASTNKQLIRLDTNLVFTREKVGTRPITLLRDKDCNVILTKREKTGDFSFFNFTTKSDIDFNVENIDTSLYHSLADIGNPARNKYISKHYDLKIDPNNPYSIIKHNDQYWQYSPNLSLIKSKKVNGELVKLNDIKNITANKSLIDKEGNLWFCTLGNGIFKLNDQIESNFNIKSISEKDKFTVMSEYKNTLLLGTSSGLIYQLKGDKCELVIKTEAPKLEYGQYNLNVVKILNSSSSNLYVGIDYGIIKYDENFDVLKSTTLNVKDINTYNDDLLVSTYSGCYSFSEEKFERTNRIYTQRTTTNFIDKAGNLWLGTNKGCTMYHSNETTQWIPTDSLLNTVTVNDIEQSQEGYILIATNGDGLMILDEEYKILKELNISNGLSHNIINHILVDGDNIWLSTKYGISHVTINSRDNINIRNYKQNIGLESNTVLQTAVMDDKLVILTPENLATVDLAKLLNLKSITPNIHLDNIYINGKSTTKSQLQNLEYYENELEVHFTSMSINHPDEINFRYKLKGSSDTWKVTKDRKVKFEGLGPKNYNLEIIATVPGQSTHNAEAIISLPISISPIWYRNNWIRALIFFLVMSTIMYFISSKLSKQKKELQQELEISQLQQKALLMEMNPHFINNCLSSIQNFVLTGDRREASNYLTKFAKLIRVILSDSRNREVGLSQEIEHLELYLDLEKLRFSNQFDYEIKADIKRKESIVLPTMMIQPLVENVIMHAFDFTNSKNKHLEIIFNEMDNYLKCEVIDNGMGLSKSLHNSKEASSGIALANIRKRIKHLAKEYPLCKFEINEYETDEESGTKAVLIIPISKSTHQ